MKKTDRLVISLSLFYLLIFGITLVGCGGGGGGSDSNPPASVFSISGRVTVGGTGLAGVTVTLSGTSSSAATTDSNGNYSFANVVAGSYTVTPSLSGYTYSPANRAVTVSNNNVTGQDFTATVITGSVYTISGTITLDGAGLAGVTVNLSGSASSTATTDGNGNYTFANVTVGSYTLTPSKSGYTYSPSNRAVTVSSDNVTGQDFTATVVTGPVYTISGKIMLDGAGLAGVTVNLSGSASSTTTTDGNGNYSFTGVQDRSYTVTPSLSGYTFGPTSIAIVVTGGDVSGVDFTAMVITGPTFTVSGTITLDGTGLAGVTVSLSGNGLVIATTDGNGNYIFTNVVAGSYTVTPSQAGYTYSPSTRAVTVSNNNVTGQDFAAAVITGPTYTISGTITMNQTGISGVTVLLSGAGAAIAITDANGTYFFAGIQNGSYTLTPSLGGYAFAPTSLAPTVSGADVPGQDFAATNTGGISVGW